ncbi:MAG: OmpA family protein [Paludibacteraceae bacterium]|nr:OmpA family protein [Paludibacteraceae bacterium]
MRKILLIIMILHYALGSVHCQQYSIKSKKAIKLYQEAKGAQYPSDKIALLNLAIDKEPLFVEAYWELSKIYQLLDSTNAAILTLQAADQQPTAMLEETKIRLSKLYYSKGEYQLALDKLSEINNPYYLQQVALLKPDYEYAASLKANPIDFKPRNLTYVNTIHDDYFPSITADGLMISTTVLSPKWMGDAPMQYQEDMYVSYWNGSKWSYSEPLPAPMNGYGNEGSQSFSADGRYMFFVQCTNQENVGSCDIWYSIRKGDKWSNPINLGEPANSRYWESNPVMSPTGDMIYFTSNRPNGLGGKDIWCVQVYIDDYGYLKTYNPQPLGKPINTDKDEFAPFIHADNHTLYFSSDGHKGLGGQDIFRSVRSDNSTWSTPENLGYPINTHGDESGFVINGLGNRAYFASDQLENNGKKLDIYEIDLPINLQPRTRMVYSPGRVYDIKTGKPLQARVEIFEGATNVRHFESISDAANGSFVAFLPENSQLPTPNSQLIFALSAQREGYLPYTMSITSPGDSILVGLTRIASGNSITLNNLYFDYDSDKILPNSYAEIQRLMLFLKQNKNIKIKIVGHTDNQGSNAYNLDLSRRRAEALMNALIQKGISADRLIAEGKGSTQPITTNDTEEGRAQNRRVEVIIQ